MKSLLKKYFKAPCEVIVDEAELTKAVKILHCHGIHSNLKIEDCGEWLGVHTWSINFYASGKQLSAIKVDLRNANFRDIMVVSNTTTWCKVEKLI